jgi:hypothetical protein
MNCNWQLRTTFFFAIMQWVVVIPYQCHEMLVRNYHYSYDSLEDCSSHLLGGGGLKLCCDVRVCCWFSTCVAYIHIHYCMVKNTDNELCFWNWVLGLFVACGTSVRIVPLAAWNNGGTSDQMFVKFYVGEFWKNLLTHSRFLLKQAK